MKRLPLVLALLVLACSADDETLEPLDLAGPPAAIEAVGGEGQVGGSGTTLGQPLAVRVTDADDKPVPGVDVTWTVERGTLSAGSAETNTDGVSEVSWTLPATVGLDEARASVEGAGSVAFTATVQPVSGTVVFRYLDAGGYHACGITTTEQLLCWGYGADGQLGLGSTVPQTFPTLIPGDNRYRMITGGYYHSCAFTLATAAYCWGNNSDGRLGNGSEAGRSDAPVEVLTAASVDTTVADTIIGGGRIHILVQDLDAGFAHSCAVDLSQHAYCWGRNSEGQVGRGALTPGEHITNATLVTTSQLFKVVTVGGLHSCGVTVDGDGLCWGYNVAGQLGDGSTTTTPAPAPVATGRFRTDPAVLFHSPDPDFPLPPGPFMAAGYDHTCGILESGGTVCWGLNEHGQLGDGTGTTHSTPASVAGGHSFAAITAGLRHTCALDTSGAAWCWGDNRLGQLGDGTRDPSAVPVAVSGGLPFAYLKAGELFTCGVTSAGVAWCWGDNEYGQLGDGTTISSPTPLKVAFQP